MTRNFLLGQLSFLAGVIICVLLSPEGLTANAGVSYYSSVAITLLPYSLSLLATAWFAYKMLGFARLSVLRGWIKLLILLVVLVVVFPFQVNDTIETLHSFTSASLFLAELGFAAWLTIRFKPDVLNYGLLIGAVGAVLLTLFYFNRVVGYLIAGELLFQLLFTLTALRPLIKLSGLTGHRAVDD